MAFGEKMTGSLEDNILTAIVTNDDVARQIIPRLEIGLFSTRPYQKIIQRAFDHWEKYGRTIGITHLRDEMEQELRRDADGRFLNQVLDAIEKLALELQSAFVLDKLDEFITVRRMTLEVRKAENALHDHSNIEAARVFCWQALNSAPEPHVLPDPWAELVPPPFGLDVLPRTLRNFVQERSEAMGVDPAGLAWAALAACSAALDGSLRLEIETGFEVPPGLWVLLVGESGIGKTPITRATWHHLERLQLRERETWQTEKAEWEQQPKEGRSPEPRPKRFIAKDTTIEKMQDILALQDRGCSLLVDEWASFIGQHDRYSAGKGAGLVARAFYLRSWDGGLEIVDRVGRGTLFIRNLHLVIFGGVQPERLRALGNLTDDGLLQRACAIILRGMQNGTGEPEGRHSAQYEALIEYLANVKVDDAYLICLDHGARIVRDRVKQRIAELRGNNALGGGFRAFVDKLMSTWGRLTLVLGFVMHEDGTRLAEIGAGPAEAAEALIEHLLVHAARFYAWQGGGSKAETTQAVAGYLLTKPRARIVSSDLTNNVHACRQMSLQAVQQAVSPLVAMGWLVPEQEHNTKSWRVPQRIYTQFAERAAKESYRRKQVRELIQGDVAARRALHEKPDENEGVCISSTNKNDPKQNMNITRNPDSHAQSISPEMSPTENNLDSHAKPTAADYRRKFIYRRPDGRAIDDRQNQSEE